MSEATETAHVYALDLSEQRIAVCREVLRWYATNDMWDRLDANQHLVVLRSMHTAAMPVDPQTNIEVLLALGSKNVPPLTVGLTLKHVLEANCAGSFGTDVTPEQAMLRAIDPLQSAYRNRTVRSGGSYISELHNFVDIPIDELSWKTPLWPVRSGRPILEGLERLRRGGTAWDYWHRWLGGMVIGNPIAWPLQERVCAISNDIWRAGPEKVAEAIHLIEDTLESGDPLDEDVGRAQVRSLVQNALKVALQAHGLQNLVQMAVDAYRREISNALPDELQPLEQLPLILDQIAIVLSGDMPTSQEEEQLYSLIQDMARTINELNRRLECAHAGRIAAEGRIVTQSAGRLFSDAFYTHAGAGFGKMISSKMLWGGVIAGGAMIMGVGSEAATDKLAWLCNEVILPEGPDAPLLPPSSDGGAKFVKPPSM